MSSDRSRFGELAEVRRDLRELRLYVEDAELAERIDDWIQASREASDADTAREYVESELNKLLANNKMYHAADVERGEDAFPARCSECVHYGSACPVLRDNTETVWRERKLEQAETEQEARQVYQRQATDVSCEVIPELLEEWDDRHADLARRGDELLSHALEAVRGDVAELDEDPPEVLAGGEA